MTGNTGRHGVAAKDGEAAHDGGPERMQAALRPVVALGPGFLAGSVHADDMAHTMVQAVQRYVEGEKAHPDAAGRPLGRDGQELRAALAEIYTCGSGYLADRCDAACVARTMTEIVREFGDLAPAR